jgi:exonuclease III
VICGEAPGQEGNSEMSAFLYRSAYARFLGEVEQVVLGKKQLVLGKHQFARPPFVVNFEVGALDQASADGRAIAGRSRITACTAHTYYGAAQGPKFKRRVAEINALTQLVVNRAKRESSTAFLLGDLNVVGPGDDTMEPLRRRQIALPDELLVPTNVKGDKFYTQIAFQATQVGPRLRNAGVFPIFDYMFRPDDRSLYQKEMQASAAWETRARKRRNPDPQEFYEEWRTFQLSDHLPVWIELDV